MAAPTLDDFRSEAVRFLDQARRAGTACPAFGAILPPRLIDEAKAWQKYCHEQGFAGLHWPEAYGGRGLTRDHTVIWYEECARVRIAPYLNLQGMVLAGEALLRAGTPAQKEQLLEPTLRGDIVWCQLFSEPGAGSDLAGLSTRAELDGDRFVVNGQKVWSSNADLAQYGILLARTDGSLPAHKGLSFFCYDMTLAGTEIRPLRQMTGDSEFCEVFMTDVSMPADALLGELNEGWRVAMTVLEDERGSFGAAGAISLTRRLEELADGVDRSDPVQGAAFADLVVRGKTLGYVLQQSSGDPVKAPLAKLLRSEMDFDAVGTELMATGPEGMINSDLSERFLYSPGMLIAGGSSEIQRNIIAERLLGLPREPR